MPLQKLQFRPGVNRESTTLANEGGWFESDKVRFRSGFPEKIGGWINLAALSSAGAASTFKGVARDMWNWITLAFANLNGVGTNQKYYIESGGQYNDITPVLSTGTLAANPFATTNGSKLVTVTSSGHGLSAGTWVTFSGASAVGGLTLNGSFEVITAIDGNTYTIVSSTAASSTATGGGAAVAYSYQIPAGGATFTTGNGWGAGTWGGITSSTVTNTLSSGINSSVTTIGVTSITGFASPSGTIQIDAESITYTGIAGSSFTGCTRGANGTVAASHSSGASVYQNGTGWGAASVVGIGTQLRLWSSDNYGQNLLLAPRQSSIYYWVAPASTSTFNPAVTLKSLVTTTLAPSAPNLTAAQTAVPGVTYQIISSDVQRFVIALGATPYDDDTTSAFNPLLVRWSDQGNAYQWVPAVTNQAGEYTLSNGSFIMGARATRQEILVWTDSAIYSMQYLGAPYVWGFQILMDNISVMSPNSMITVNNITYWMGKDRFYMYSGRVEVLPCALRQYIFADINQDQAYQVFAGANEAYNEVWWFYVDNSSGGTSINKYVIYNYLDKVWYYGTMARSAWLQSGIQPYPIAADYNNRLVYHEVGNDDNSTTTTQPIYAYIQSSDIDIAEGENFSFVWRILPDVNFNGSTVNNPAVTMTVRPRQNSGTPYGTADNPQVVSAQNYTVAPEYTIQQFTGQVYTRLRGRQMAFRIESDSLGVAWQLGSPRLQIQPDGRR